MLSYFGTFLLCRTVVGFLTALSNVGRFMRFYLTALPNTFNHKHYPFVHVRTLLGKVNEKMNEKVSEKVNEKMV